MNKLILTGCMRVLIWFGLVCDGSLRDYHGSLRAGLHALLIRRPGEFSDGATRTKTECLDGVNVVESLDDAVAFVQRWNARSE